MAQEGGCIDPSPGHALVKAAYVRRKVRPDGVSTGGRSDRSDAYRGRGRLMSVEATNGVSGRQGLGGTMVQLVPTP